MKRFKCGPVRILYESLNKHPDQFLRYNQKPINIFQELLNLVKPFFAKPIVSTNSRHENIRIA